jgi:tetratricopeptide (TPR) repeat protein
MRNSLGRLLAERAGEVYNGGMTFAVAPVPPAGRQYLWGGALLLLVMFAYAPVFSAGFIWDDPDYLINNLTLRSPRGLVRIWLEPRASPQYYPLVFTTFWVEFRLWGMNPPGYHFTNVLLHGAGAVLFWLVLTRLGVPGAWLGAALFAVHPVQVESVAWVTERKNVLSGFFYWSALLSYFHFAWIGEDVRADRPGRWGWYVGSLLFFLCALLSKSVTCTLPAVLVLLLWWQRGLTRRDLYCLAPMFVLGVGMGLNTAFLEVTQVGAVGEEYELGKVERVLLAGRAIWFYLGKLVWPTELIFIYPRWQLDAAEPWQYLFPLAAIGLGGLLWWTRTRLGWGPLIAYLCFAGTLFPALGFFDVYPFRYSFVADHFQYLACAAPFAVLGALATLASRNARPAFNHLLAGLLLVALCGLTWAQAHVYRDMITLFQDTVDKNPACWMAWNNLGNLFLEREMYAEAENGFRQCLALKPDHFRARRGLARTLFVQGRGADAKSELFISLQKLEERSRTADTEVQKRAIAREYTDIGMFHEYMGDDAEAERLFRLALGVFPDEPMSHFRLGNSLGKKSKFTEAIPHLRVMTQAQPDSAQAHYYLAQALHAAGQGEEASASAREALRLAEAEGNQALVRTIHQRFP